MENSASDFGQHIPSSFKNSCPGTSAEGATVEDYFSNSIQGTDTLRPVHDFQVGGHQVQGEAHDEIIEKARIGREGWKKIFDITPKSQMRELTIIC